MSGVRRGSLVRKAGRLHWLTRPARLRPPEARTCLPDFTGSTGDVHFTSGKEPLDGDRTVLRFSSGFFSLRAFRQQIAC